jgi:L-alanine-DL-glutamate epimerase-like enolase superfamily enzyme
MMDSVKGAAGVMCIIEDVKIVECLQRQHDPSWKFARGNITHVAGWIVKARSGDGLTGYGHIMATPIFNPDTEAALRAAETMKKVLIGEDAFSLERLHHALALAAPGHACVLSGMTSALHDLVSKRLQIPLHRLLGGKVRDEIPVSRILSIKEPEKMAEQAAKLAAEGYRFLKVKVNGDVETDIARVRAVRRAVGDAIGLTVDANQAYDADSAIKVCRGIADSGVLIMEQPVPAADHAGLKRVTDTMSDLTIEADESIKDLPGLMHLIAMRAAGSYNLKMHYLGGIRNTAIAMRICEAAGVGYRFGAIFGPRLVISQAIQVASTARTMYPGGAELAEFEHLLDDPFSGLEVRDGAVPVLDGIGAGVNGHLD